jgi:membrane dipeptidase
MKLCSLFMLVSLCRGETPSGRADTFPIEPDLPCAVANDQPRTGYHVDLTPEGERRASAVYHRSIIITAHDHCFHADDFKAQASAAVTVRTIKPIVDGHYRQGGIRYPIETPVAGWRERGVHALQILRQHAQQSNGRIRLVLSAADIESVKKQGQLGIIMSFEGGRALAGDLANLAMYHEMGLREMQLYWAVPSPLKDEDGSLSLFGQDVIREMNRLRLVVDISHMPEKAWRQALALARAPVVVSHCGAAAISGRTNRGTDDLRDDTIRAIASQGGVMCVHFYEGYIPARHGPVSTVRDLVDHIDHFRAVAGIDHIGLGTDYFPEKGWKWVAGAETIEGMKNVVREMVYRGYTDAEIEKVLGRNLLRVYRQVWGK